MNTAGFVRRNRVDERWALGIAAVGALLAVLAGSAPTGSGPVDALLVFVAAAAVIWASASAPWWSVALACGVGASIALDPVVAAVGGVGFLAGLIVGVRRRDNAELRAVAGAVAVNALIRSDLDGFLGLSAIIGVIVGCGLLVLGLSRRKSAIRRPAWIALGSVGGIAVLAALGLAVAASAARPDVSSGAETAQRGLDALDAGEYDRAAQLFDDAAANFDAASDSLGGGLAMPSRLLPGISQNVRAGDELAGVAAESLRTAASALRQVDPSTLTVVGGAIDVQAVAAVEEPLEQVQQALLDLTDVTTEVRTPWLLGPLQRELDELEADIARQEPRLENAIDTVRVAPAILGAGGERRYLVLFTSPAEARGLGGFVGNYAEISIRDGRVSVTDFDRRSELEDEVRQANVRCDECPTEFVDVYGRYGFTTGEDGGVGDRGWSNITMPVHFPYVAETAAALYPQSGGRDIDGVIVMDPYVVEALMAYTGPIEVPELDTVVQPDSAAEFILRDQYLLAEVDGADGQLDNVERIDALETLGTQVINRLLSGSLPEPVDLADALAPLVAERRLLVWTDQPDEQDVLDRIGLLGALPELGEAGGFSMAVTNAGASKIDTFLTTSTSVVVEERAEKRVLRAETSLTNGAPASGLPDYVIGNAVGLPTGSSRLLVAFYGPPGLESITVDGQPVAVSALEEAGWTRYGTSVDLGPGDSVAFELEFLVPGPSLAVVDPVLFAQPLATRR